MNPAINAHNINFNYSAPIAEASSSVSEQEMAGAMANAYGGYIAEALVNQISQRSDIPRAKIDEVSKAVSAALDSGKLPTSEDAEKLMLEVAAKFLEKAAQEEVSEAGETASKAGAKGGNWLVQLAKAMGLVAGRHLENMVNLAGKISALDGHQTTQFVDESMSVDQKAEIHSANEAATATNADTAKQMAALTAEMQAESQMFKMTQEMTTTVVKGIGEALHSTARKQ